MMNGGKSPINNGLIYLWDVSNTLTRCDLFL